MKNWIQLAALPLIFSLLGAGDPPILFENPSFEGSPASSTCPSGWVSGSPGSTPDIQPGAWEVQSPDAHDGHTYIGLIAREDGTREDIGQMLSRPLAAGKCYIFSVWLAHANGYAGHRQPLRLRVWGGATKGAKTQLLATSDLIDSKNWEEAKFQFTPAADIRFICFEADYAPGTLFKYKGNILLDHLSSIIKCDRA